MRLARPAIPLRTWLIFFALVALVLVAPDVLAQDQTQQRYTGILQAFRDQSIRWQGVLSASARWLFFTLAIAQFAWVNMELALRGGDISDFIAENTRGILATGIMYVFLVHSFDWSTSLVMGFRQAGERAVIASAGAGAESTLDPAGVFQNGLIVAGSLFSQMGIWSGADNVSLVICALVLLVCFAFLAAFMALAIVESYIVIGASVLMLGFGGSRWTSDIAKRTLMYAVAVGAKLFTMQLIVGVAMGSVITWAQTYESDNSTSTLSLVGLVLLVTICAKMIPEIVQGILSGSSPGGPGAMMATVAASVAAATAGTAALRAGGAAAGGAGAGASAGAAVAGAGAPGAAGSGAAGAAAFAGSDTRSGGAASRAFSESSGNLAKMAGSIIETGSGLHMGSALGPLQSAGRGGDSPPSPGAGVESVGAKPAPPSDRSLAGGQPLASAASSTSSSDGGVIKPAASSSPRTSSGQASAEPGASGSGTGASASVSSSAAAPSSPPAGKSPDGSDARSLDARADDAGAALASEQLQPAASAAGGAPESSFGGDPQTLDQRAEPEPPDASSSRLRHATRGALAGFVAAGPGGAAIGAAVGAAAGPHIDAIGKRAAERWAQAKQRFGLT